MKIIEKPYETGQTTYYGFTIEHKGAEYEGTLIRMRDENSASTDYSISRVNEEPSVDERELITLLAPKF